MTYLYCIEKDFFYSNSSYLINNRGGALSKGFHKIRVNDNSNLVFKTMKKVTYKKEDQYIYVATINKNQYGIMPSYLGLMGKT